MPSHHLGKRGREQKRGSIAVGNQDVGCSATQYGFTLQDGHDPCHFAWYCSTQAIEPSIWPLMSLGILGVLQRPVGHGWACVDGMDLRGKVLACHRQDEALWATADFILETLARCKDDGRPALVFFRATILKGKAYPLPRCSRGQAGLCLLNLIRIHLGKLRCSREHAKARETRVSSLGGHIRGRRARAGRNKRIAHAHAIITHAWRGGRVVEGAALEKR